MTHTSEAPSWGCIYGEFHVVGIGQESHRIFVLFSAPLLGPAIGPMIGGLLTEAFDWRATFWFLAIFTGLCFISFLFFQDTFRRERSSAFQAATRLTEDRAARRASRFSTLSQATVVESEVLDISKEAVLRLDETFQQPTKPRRYSIDIRRTMPDDEKPMPQHGADDDLEAQACTIPDAKDIKHALHNMNPTRPIMIVLCRVNNLAISVASGTFLLQ